MSDILDTGTTRAFSVNPLGAPEPDVYLHCAVFVTRDTILGAETFRLESFQGQENVSEPFEFQLELVANSDGRSPAPVTFRFDELIGRAITVGIGKRREPGASAMEFRAAIEGNPVPGARLSLFNGIVTSFAVKNRGSYAITMKPALHRLSLTNNYRVFHRRTVWEMIAQLLDAHHIAYLPFQHAQHNLAVIRRQDWMQAGETDLEFLKRLMGKALLYFYFVHTGNGHALVFSNLAHYPEAVPGGRPLRYTYSDATSLGLEQEDVVTEFSMKKSMGSTGVQGVLTQQDGAWLGNPVVEFNSFYANDLQDANPLPFNLYKSYQYGGSKEEVQHLSAKTRSTLDGSRNELSGASNCATFRVGHRFTLTSGDGPTNPHEPFLDNGAFVLTAIQHQASADGTYRNQFQAGDASYLITPYSIQATQQGSVLAKVVAGEPPDAAGAVDFGSRDSFRTGQSSFGDALNNASYEQVGVYVRFSTAAPDAAPVWVKLSASMQTAPTVGSVVVVGRAQDESELPEIQNVIQTNGSELVVKGDWLSNTHVGNNYSTSYGDNQSIGYGTNSTPDLSQSTQIVSDAYNTDRFDNVSFTQGSSYSFNVANSRAVGASSSSAELYGGVVADDILSASESLGSTYSRQVGSISHNYSQIDNATAVSINLTNTSTTTIGASTTNTNIGASTTNSNIGVSTTISYTGQVFTKSVTGDAVENITSLNTTRTSQSGNLIENSVSGNVTRVSTTGDITETSTVGNTVRISVSGNVDETNTVGDTIRVSTTGDVTENNTVGNTVRNSISGNLVESIEQGSVERTTITGTVTEETTRGDVTTMTVDGEITEVITRGESTLTSMLGNATLIETSGATSNIVTNAELTEVQTAGPGARVSNNDETPHVDNIVTRVYMIEATIIFM
ncbi:contractile injection system protein, VgrG/Pvc8 family [Burkholderia plantarii]|uniref:Type VI secretion system protein, Vgr family protein VgrG n=1 Tax=Burkholderia plantarii TaxID=41899 RepID=A0A0B6RXH0_BURPL|nr:contractile injection system protein, VgrG/Pvc8 family [Burkholderia plantarii]AJK50067.1 type VI secretion system protein, Vgr family protein VgrG [Burkholderia plantarii]